MQRALENLAPGVTNGNKTVFILGSSAGGALEAATSAFTLSTLPAAGWTLTSVDGVANLNTFFSTGIAGAGIIMMDSAGNVGGGTTGAELGVFTANATTIDNFLGSGGSLFSQSNGYGWVTALLPTLGALPPGGSDSLSLTPLGTAAFPGLTNSDLSSGPYHNTFTNTGTLPILVVNTANAPVVLGGQGNVTNPFVAPVPEPGTALGGVAAGLVGLMRRRRQS
jgi:hypothetical protein